MNSELQLIQHFGYFIQFWSQDDFDSSIFRFTFWRAIAC